MKKLRTLCAALALALLMTSLAAPIALAATKKAVVTEDAKLRASAKASAKVLDTLKKGVEVTVKGVQGKIAKVVYDGKTGYVAKSKLKLVKAAKETAVQAAPTATPSGETRAVLRAAVVYKKASTGAEKLAKLKKGEKIEVLATSGDWVKVKRGGKKGYLLKTAFLEEPEATVKPTPTPTPAPQAETVVTKKNARLYAKASKASASKKVTAGTQLTLVDESGNWYKVKKGGVSGYMLKSAFAEPEPTAAPTPVPAAVSPSYGALKAGSKGDAVLKLQKRLEALGYLDAKPSGKYSSSTQQAVKLFQQAADLKATGDADAQTQEALYSSKAPKSSILSASMKIGSTGSGVKRLQMRLKAKGYYEGSANGRYTDAVAEAVKRFQAAAGLKADGIAASGTLGKLYSAAAPDFSEADLKPTATPTPTPTAEPTPTPKPTATPKPTSAGGASTNDKAKAEKVISAAMTKLGKPYIFGATGPNSYDCSGFTMFAYGTVGISLPHSAYSQGYASGKKVTLSQLQRGDIVCFNTMSDSDLSDHVGIYLGGGQFIHASSGQGKVVISSLTSGYYQSAFSWGRSVL